MKQKLRLSVSPQFTRSCAQHAKSLSGARSTCDSRLVLCTPLPGPCERWQAGRAVGRAHTAPRGLGQAPPRRLSRGRRVRESCLPELQSQRKLSRGARGRAVLRSPGRHRDAAQRRPQAGFSTGVDSWLAYLWRALPRDGDTTEDSTEDSASLGRVLCSKPRAGRPGRSCRARAGQEHRPREPGAPLDSGRPPGRNRAPRRSPRWPGRAQSRACLGMHKAP